jgi:predicted sugar kinase
MHHPENEGLGVTKDELILFTSQVGARLNRIEVEIESLVSVKKWVMSLVAVLVLQFGGFIYGYGGMSERLENTVLAVRSNNDNRFQRSEAIALENTIRREMDYKGRLDEQRISALQLEITHLKDMLKK